MSQHLSSPKDPVILSYLGQRKAVGLIGIALPFVLVLGNKLLHQPLQTSISAYYYTCMRNVLVGSLCAIGVFLISCMGYDERDRIAGILGGTFAIGVAFFPMKPVGVSCLGCDPDPAGHLHVLCATLLFVTLAYFCLFQFTQSDTAHPTPRKRIRNLIYRICGGVIIASIILAGLFGLDAVQRAMPFPNSLFCFESTAIEAFGIAWLTKGEAIFKDLKLSPRSASWSVRDRRIQPVPTPPDPPQLA